MVGGIFRTNMNKAARWGEWQPEQANQFDLTLNLDTGEVTVKINGQTYMDQKVVEKVKGQSIRIIEFRDGTAFGGYDGLFIAGVDNIKITHTP